MNHVSSRLLLCSVTFLISFLVVKCVSRTVPHERFRESAALAAPTFNVTLPNPEKFSFAIVGDLHISGEDTTRFAKILTAATAEGDAFLVLLGDNTEKGELKDVTALKKAIVDNGWDGRVVFAVGNHDIFDDGWTNYKTLLGPSHLSVVFGNSQILVLDTADGVVAEDEKKWLEDELKKTKPKHRFLASHYLPMVPGQRTYLKLANEAQALELMKKASVFGVTAWMGGHYHSHGIQDVDGVKYLVAGGGGGRMMAPEYRHFFVQVLVDGDNVTYEKRIIPSGE